ncbi:SpoIIE family protein phosphatase [Streptomyces malaysiense]|uniref:Protein phosphatase n=1 Tax=Streptomyces malaysiense TaxID=1428626 RepID=A0A1J4QB94_9ACTN|nr:SpoIIE family protein phosphatase [Streptomyces malaysiense]OIK29638.1 protein phosphatase [Streptomyces malaysiense]
MDDPGTGAESAAPAEVEARQRAGLERPADLAVPPAVLERAKGALMAVTGCTPDAADQELRRRAEDSGRTLLEQCRFTLDSLRPRRDPPAPERPRSAPAPRATPAPGAADASGTVEVLGGMGRDLLRVRSAHELADRLLHHLAPQVRADAVLLYEWQDEGGLELAGHAGIDEPFAARWRHVPPLTGLPAIEALTAGEPLWLQDLPADRARHTLVGGPPERWPSRVWLPVPAGGTARFVLGVLRRCGGPFEPHERQLLLAAARLCAGRLRVFDAARQAPGDPRVAEIVQAVFDALPGAAVLLTPLRTAAGEVADYRIDAATPQAVDVSGRTGPDLVGRLILESYPSVAGEPLWRGYLETLESGVPFESEPFAYRETADGVTLTGTFSVRAAPLGAGLLVSWLRHDPLARQEQRLADVQRLGNLGWANWNLLTREISWSGQAYAVLGCDPDQGPLELEKLPRLAVPRDADALTAAIAGLIHRGRPYDMPFRVETPEGVRHLRMVAEAVSEPDGTPAEVHGFVQDLTAQRSAELALVRSERTMSLQRGVLQAERALAARLQHALLPLPSKPVRLAGLRVEVAYLPAQAGIHVGGDWFSAIELPDYDALFVVGDVAGHGIDAVATMAQLRFTAKGMVSTGTSLTVALARLNHLLLHSRDSRMTATMVMARYDPQRRLLAWAQAGHPPPLLVRGRDVRYLDRPGGLLLGAAADPHYESAELRLEPGDRLLLYTDGLVERPGESLDAGLDRLARAVRAHGDGESGSLSALLTAMLVDEWRDDVCVVDIRVPVTAVTGPRSASPDSTT